MAQEKQKQAGRKRAVAIVLLLLLLALLWWFLNRPHSAEPDSIPTASDTGSHQKIPADRIPAMTDTLEKDSAKVAPPKRVDSAHAALPPIADSTPVDTVAAVAADPCAADTLAPWVTPDPAGGLHFAALGVLLRANKACSIEYRMGRDGPWQTFTGAAIPLARSETLLFRAEDACGRRMEERAAVYEIRSPDPLRRCPADMVYVDTRGISVCVDRYEWPNRSGVRPRSSVSLYQAQDSCFLVAKRLCTTAEWSAACSGPAGSRYPYGNEFEPRICATRDSAVGKSGARPECRSWFGAFDMSGNLAEWTSTKAPGKEGFNNVMGGFWESAGQSSCAEPRYSYYPQNRHNPVGFRCCKEAEQP